MLSTSSSSLLSSQPSKNMRTPRRVPWSSLSELEQVCNWIYNDDHDLEAKLSAVNRVSFIHSLLRKLPSHLSHSVDICLACHHSVTACIGIYTQFAYCEYRRPEEVAKQYGVFEHTQSSSELCNGNSPTGQWSRRPTSTGSVCTLDFLDCFEDRSSAVVGRVAACCDARGVA